MENDLGDEKDWYSKDYESNGWDNPLFLLGSTVIQSDLVQLLCSLLQAFLVISLYELNDTLLPIFGLDQIGQAPCHTLNQLAASRINEEIQLVLVTHLFIMSHFRFRLARCPQSSVLLQENHWGLRETVTKSLLILYGWTCCMLRSACFPEDLKIFDDFL